MAYLSAVGSIALIWFLVVTIPGPNFIVVTQVSMAQSRRMGFFIAAGVSMGAGTWATASLVGLGALFRYAAWMYDAFTIIGGCYLIYLGIVTIRNAVKFSDVPVTGGQPAQYSNTAAFRKGLLTSFSNPKTAAFFGSLFLSTFPEGASLWFHVITVALVIGISVVWYWLVACFFSFGPVRRFYKSTKRILDILTGSLLSFLGGRLIVSRA